MLVSSTDTFLSFCNYAAKALCKLFPDELEVVLVPLFGGGGGGGRLFSFYDLSYYCKEDTLGLELLIGGGGGIGAAGICVPMGGGGGGGGREFVELSGGGGGSY